MSVAEQLQPRPINEAARIECMKRFAAIILCKCPDCQADLPPAKSAETGLECGKCNWSQYAQ